MRAIRQYEFGPPENLRYEEVLDPRPDAGQVGIAVRACGVHLVDTMLRKGTYEGPFALPDLPMTPGREVAGVVDELGDGVEKGWLGRRVVVHLGMANGGYAERAVANAADLHPLPDDLDDDAAVAMVGTGRMTVGILDGVGGEAGQAAFDLLAPGGRLVVFGWSGGEPVRFTAADLLRRSLSASVALGPGILRHPGGLRALQERALAEAAAGRLVPAVQTFVLKDAAAAHRALETRATVGKVVLVP